jgi:uncharacterized damage-inducible protein DinB
MFRKVDDFISAYGDDSAMTKKYLAAMTDESLSQPVADGHRTLGRIAWHLAQTIPEMLAKTGLTAEGPGENDPVPTAAADIARAYGVAADSLLAQVREHWTDETLEIEDEMYGSKWSRGFTLHCLADHECHHRGQMSILMRQAGLTVPGVMGPAKEEWVNMGMEAPEI